MAQTLQEASQQIEQQKKQLAEARTRIQEVSYAPTRAELMRLSPIEKQQRQQQVETQKSQQLQQLEQYRKTQIFPYEAQISKAQQQYQAQATERKEWFEAQALVQKRREYPLTTILWGLSPSIEAKMKQIEAGIKAPAGAEYRGEYPALAGVPPLSLPTYKTPTGEVLSGMTYTPEAVRRMELTQIQAPTLPQAPTLQSIFQPKYESQAERRLFEAPRYAPFPEIEKPSILKQAWDIAKTTWAGALGYGVYQTPRTYGREETYGRLGEQVLFKKPITIEKDIFGFPKVKVTTPISYPSTLMKFGAEETRRMEESRRARKNLIQQQQRAMEESIRRIEQASEDQKYYIQQQELVRLKNLGVTYEETPEGTYILKSAVAPETLAMEVAKEGTLGEKGLALGTIALGRGAEAYVIGKGIKGIWSGVSPFWAKLTPSTTTAGKVLKGVATTGAVGLAGLYGTGQVIEGMKGYEEAGAWGVAPTIAETTGTLTGFALAYDIPKLTKDWLIGRRPWSKKGAKPPKTKKARQKLKLLQKKKPKISELTKQADPYFRKMDNLYKNQGRSGVQEWLEKLMRIYRQQTTIEGKNTALTNIQLLLNKAKQKGFLKGYVLNENTKTLFFADVKVTTPTAVSRGAVKLTTEELEALYPSIVQAEGKAISEYYGKEKWLFAGRSIDEMGQIQREAPLETMQIAREGEVLLPRGEQVARELPASSLASFTLPLSATGEVSMLKSSLTSASEQKLQEILKQQEKQKEVLLSRQISKQEQKSRQMQKSALSTALVSKSAQATRQVTKQITGQQFFKPTPTRIRGRAGYPKPPKPTGFKWWRRKGEARRRKYRDPLFKAKPKKFIGEIRRRGKWKPVTAPTKYKIALGVARKKTLTTLGASLRVREAGTGRLVGVPTDKLFRPSKRDPLVAVQRKRKPGRIAHPLEKLEIKRARKLKKYQIW